MKPKIVVAYSGGLDTSVMVPWLSEKWDAEIITATGDLGQASELVGLKEKALKTGAVRAFVKDLRREFLENYVWPALKAGAVYEQAYPLATALGRPLLAKYLVDVALQEGASMVAHGCTGKGNDQVRFEVTVAALAPHLKCLAPLRDWEFKSRDEEILYAQLKGIPIQATVSSPYSLDQNLWGTSIECGVLEDPEVEPPADAYQRTVAPEDAPGKPVYVSVEFVQGVPVAIDGDHANPIELVTRLNEIGGAHGVGRVDLVENRLVGIKSREIYEAPAATILHFAHTELERLTLDKATAHTKAKISADYASLVYNGLWYSPLRSALDAFVNETQRTVTGRVKVKLYKGHVSVAARSSVFSLYNPKLATYTHEDTFDHKASEGFIKIFALPVKQAQQVQREATASAPAKKAKAKPVPELVS